MSEKEISSKLHPSPSPEMIQGDEKLKLCNFSWKEKSH
jgi:hypothetical protein